MTDGTQYELGLLRELKKNRVTPLLELTNNGVTRFFLSFLSSPNSFVGTYLGVPRRQPQ